MAGSSNRLKRLSLLLLVLQTTTLVILLRYSRIIKNNTSLRYLNSTAIVMAEVLKIFACVFLIAMDEGQGSAKRTADSIVSTASNTVQMVKLSVPAFLYTVQNNLLFLALSHLDAATYQVTYQCKILTTAGFSVLILGKKLNMMKWSSLVVLTIGVIMIQYTGGRGSSSSSSSGLSASNRLVGLAAVICSCLTSGFAGVYFEKMLKKGRSSIWMQNFFLALFSIVFGLLNCFVMDGRRIGADGFFQGYSSLVWVVIMLQAFGGLVVAAVIKYADNIVKGFAVSLSIIASSITSYFVLGDFSPTINFIVGSSLVICSTFTYGYESKLSKLPV